MNRNDLRKMIIAECGCMAREGQLPNALAAVMPMLDVLGYGGDEPVTMKMGSPRPGAPDRDFDDDDGIEYEDSDEYEESGMIKNNLFNIAKHAQAMHDALEDGDDLPEWVQEKIAVANSMMSTIYDYLDAETSSMNEARKPWYMKKRRNMKKTNETEWYDIPKKKPRSVKKKK
jgi:hypothetical protein